MINKRPEKIIHRRIKSDGKEKLNNEKIQIVTKPTHKRN
jgi:hypothetical protein